MATTRQGGWWAVVPVWMRWGKYRLPVGSRTSIIQSVGSDGSDSGL